MHFKKKAFTLNFYKFSTDSLENFKINFLLYTDFSTSLTERVCSAKCTFRNVSSLGNEFLKSVCVSIKTPTMQKYH